MTEQERKDKKKAITKAWHNKNKHTEEYKEKTKASSKAWYLANSDKKKAKNKARYKAKELGYCIVYCIPNHDGLGNNYVGVTNNPYNRMQNHKGLGKLNAKEYIELDRADTRAEAEKLEAEYHARGYDGAGGWELKK